MTRKPRQQLAIALEYEEKEQRAPRLIAKGQGAIGEKIIATARANGIPIREDPLLAASLADIELGEEIPLELYKAVAEVLGFILRLSRKIQ
ncbi:MAG: EscU/YscU/HrcU family type III secretion system export apparatus switch protein [Xanthobacteraceae bacterium]